MENLINEVVVSIALFSVFATGYYTPLNVITHWIVDKYIGICVKTNQLWAVDASLLLTCAKCQAFTITLFYTWSLPQAIVSSILALAIKKMISYVAQ